MMRVAFRGAVQQTQGKTSGSALLFLMAADQRRKTSDAG
jgi:hypothetical protein